MERQPFKILSIDGGGIRGIFPAMLLHALELRLRETGHPKPHIHQHFDLICGTSTGGIIAIALALGIPAGEIHQLYMEHASTIFGNKKSFLKQLRYAAHDRQPLEKLIREKFSKANGGTDPRLLDCKTPVCIPTYDLLQGKPVVLKSKYHDRFVRDYHMPAYMAALATAAAPTFFDPYSVQYKNLQGMEVPFYNKVDGGVIANNPALLGLVEAQTAFKQPLANIRLLSVGTGSQTFADASDRRKWGLWYWMRENKKTRLIDLFMQGQSQQVQNMIRLLQNGIDGELKASPNFVYHRIDTELDPGQSFDLDETNRHKLQTLGEKAVAAFQQHASEIMTTYFS